MFYIPFHPDHLLDLDLVDEEKFIQEQFKEGPIRRRMLSSTSWSAIHDGKIVACFGLDALSAVRSMVWTVFDKDIGTRGFLQVALKQREIIQNIMDVGVIRFEAYVQPTYEKAGRYMRLLGFEREGTMVKFDGFKDFDLYARIKK